MCDAAEDLNADERNGCFKACELQRGCNFPRIRPANDYSGALDFYGEDCSITIAEYINPYHDASCAVYGIVSGVLAVRLFARRRHGTGQAGGGGGEGGLLRVVFVGAAVTAGHTLPPRPLPSLPLSGTLWSLGGGSTSRSSGR